MDVLRIAPLLAVGCAAGPDPEVILRDLAAANAEVLEVTSVAVGFDEPALYASLEDGDTVVFWEGSIGPGVVPGVAAIEGRGVYHRDDVTFRSVEWTLDLTYDALAVGPDRVDGALDLTVTETLFESSFQEHGADGAIRLGDDTLGVVYTAHFGPDATLQRLSGSLDATPVDWESPDPTAP